MENPEQAQAQAQEAHDLALERISAAKDGGERALCLSPIDLSSGGKTYPGDERLEHLTALPPEIAGLIALQSLWLHGTQVADIAPLAGLTALHTLYLHDTRVADIAPLAELTALQALILQHTLVADITPLAGLTALQSLILQHTQVADITPLTGLTALQLLDLRRTEVADITPLAGLTALYTLWLDNTQVADIAPLAGLEKLRNLNFSNIPACAADPKLAELSEIGDDEERTRLTLAYLRGEDSVIERSGNETVIKPAVGKASVTGHDATITTPDQVRTVQQGLAEAGFDPGPADGIVGDKTQQAMATALEQHGLNSSGDILSDFNKLKGTLDKLSKSKSAPAPPPDETAPFYSDQPATQDLLNRRAVAETLGTIVDEVWNERRAEEKNEKCEPHASRAERDRTFIVHLHGRWGSGKTSILNFLREVLLSGKIAPQKPVRLQNWPVDPPWVIVDYNAWRNQDLGPAWWTLMDTVYREAKSQLSSDDYARHRVWWGHFFWRFRSGYIPVTATLVVAAVATFLLLGVTIDNELLGLIKNVGAVLGVIGSIFLFKSETGVLNSRTAKRYVELARDPLGPLTERYEATIGEIGRPVAVFIDDLDRCDAKFVVELLQNIQTLFRRAPVLYVVAADRSWICTSYEQVYKPYCEPIAEPGHSLGNMFLEKIFQLSIEVPALAGAQRKAFWDHLLQTKDQVTPEDRKAIEAEVADRLEKATTEPEVIRIVDEEAEKSPMRAAIAGAQAFKRMQSRELVGEREHFLAGYADLLEANPRAMKRLLNAYGFRRGFDIQSSHRSDPDALVRWTILENRWPILADHLAGRSAGRSDGVLMDALMKDSEVRRVAEGLTREKLRTIAGAPSQPQN